MAQAVARKERVLTDHEAQKPKCGNKAPRQKGGKFGTSEAAKRRAASGLKSVSSPAALVAGFAGDLAKVEPSIPAEERLKAAQVAANAMTLGRGLAIGLIDKVRQALRLKEGFGIVLDASPRAASYAADLVDGVYPEAPHAVRLQAAFGLMEMAGYRREVGPGDDRDLSELTLEELHARSESFASELDQRLTVATHAEPSPNDLDGAPLPPSDARPELE